MSKAIRHDGHTSVTVKGYEEQKRQLQLLATTAGYARKTFMESVRSMGDDEVVHCVKYGRSMASVNKHGEFVDSEMVTEEDGTEVAKQIEHYPGVAPALQTLPAGAAPANKRIDGVVIPCGVCIIVGEGDSGKTPLAHALASYGVQSYSIVRVGEPLSGYVTLESEAAAALAKAMMKDSDVVLDSIKDLLSSDGAAMKSGLSRNALTSISAWSIAACEMGCTVYVPVNPSTPEEIVLELLAEAARSNATMSVVHKNGTWRYVARSGEGLERTKGVIDFQKGKPVRMKKGDNSLNAAATEVPPLAAAVSISAFQNSQRRAISNP